MPITEGESEYTRSGCQSQKGRARHVQLEGDRRDRTDQVHHDPQDADQEPGTDERQAHHGVRPGHGPVAPGGEGGVRDLQEGQGDHQGLAHGGPHAHDQHDRVPNLLQAGHIRGRKWGEQWESGEPDTGREKGKGNDGCCEHPCRYWHRRIRKMKSYFMYNILLQGLKGELNQPKSCTFSPAHLHYTTTRAKSSSKSPGSEIAALCRVMVARGIRRNRSGPMRLFDRTLSKLRFSSHPSLKGFVCPSVTRRTTIHLGSHLSISRGGMYGRSARYGWVVGLIYPPLGTDQSDTGSADTGSAGIFSRWTNQIQEAQSKEAQVLHRHTSERRHQLNL
eukprot:1193098-Prorocentrum_minimum.AAC.3